MNFSSLLEVKNIFVEVCEKKVLSNLSININNGCVHAIMGQNGSGKSTFAKVLTRHPGYNVISGSIIYNGIDLLSLSPEYCSKNGIFLSFQHPVSIPGVTNFQFLRESFNSVNKYRNNELLDSIDFERLVKKYIGILNISEDLLYRSLNDEFSGGEKKKNEILQMFLLRPKLVILDEIDSGLDIDALKEISFAINSYRNKDVSMILITHYNRLLDYIEPDYIHILKDGYFVQSGDKKLAIELEKTGYGLI